MRVLWLLGFGLSLLPNKISSLQPSRLISSPSIPLLFHLRTGTTHGRVPLLLHKDRCSYAVNKNNFNEARQFAPTMYKSASSTTRRHMVFTAPEESVMEQLSTKGLIDKILDECLRTSARRPIMIQFNPSSKFIWRQWKGTVFAETWKSTARHVLWSIVVYSIFQGYPNIKQVFSGFNTVWAQLLSVTTFTLTFFVNEAYSVWRRCLLLCRKLQGRLNDLVMALAGFAQRYDRRDGSSEFTNPSRKVLEIVGRYVRLFNILYYASLARSHRPLLTPQGMRRMEARGLMTPKERRVLKATPVAATQRHNAVLMWILRTVIEARKAGHIDGGFGFEQQLMSKIQEIRAQANSMESVLRGRMPFAYAHIVQVLIDAVLWMYPITVYSKGMDLSFHLGICGSIFLTSSYQGLFDLAKQLLDPFHNESGFGGTSRDSLIVDTLIAETNAGSMRWKSCLNEMPISYESIRKGALDDFLLPEEGFSKEEADVIYEEREEKKRRDREERNQALEATTRTKTPLQIYENQVKDIAKELEVVQEEFESTKLILNAPPGSDFVPGLDDKNETIPFEMDVINQPDKRKKEDGSSEKGFKSFLDAAEGELEEKKEMVIGSRGPGFDDDEIYSLGSNVPHNETTTTLGDKFLNY